MKLNMSLVAMLVVLLAWPPAARARNKKHTPRGTIESMQALPCGAKQRGLAGVGSIFGSVGATAVNTNEKLCPQYLLRTDELEYQIRPLKDKHAALLPIGQEAEFKIKRDRLFLKVPEGDKNSRKTRAYQVVAMEPVSSASTRETSYQPDRSTESRRGEKDRAEKEAEQIVNPHNPPPQ
jgi:hypothetical protein